MQKSCIKTPRRMGIKRNGKENYTIEEYKKDNRGTCITLNIKKDADEFLDAFRLRSIITKYSN